MTLQEIVVAEGYTGQFNDAWNTLFNDNVVPAGEWNDRMVRFLLDLGYTGSLSDMLRAFIATY